MLFLWYAKPSFGWYKVTLFLDYYNLNGGQQLSFAGTGARKTGQFLGQRRQTKD
jgi:hypothetical protein